MDDRSFTEHQNANQIATDMSTAAIKGALLINGGGAIAVLGFAASLIEKSIVGTGAIAAAIMYYAWGVVLAVSALATGYLANFALAENVKGSSGWGRARVCFFALAMGCLLASLALFVTGSYAVKAALIG
ncbi:hypothetical protein [Ruegeria jejuensis]|uniref:hypothetical protein n=1 Tax=Ruegeria jejuensis TaxID=3233338 RepID=UPI00355B6684